MTENEISGFNLQENVTGEWLRGFKIYTDLERVGIRDRELAICLSECDSWPWLPQQTYLLGLSLSLMVDVLLSPALSPLLCICARVCSRLIKLRAALWLPAVNHSLTHLYTIIKHTQAHIKHVHTLHTANRGNVKCFFFFFFLPSIIQL